MYKVAEYLRGKGHDADIICGRWWNADQNPEHLIGVPFLSRVYHGRRSTVSAISFTMSLAKALPALRKKYDLVEFNMSPVLHFSLIGLMRRQWQFRSAKFVGMLHEVWQEYWLRYAGLVEGSAGYLLEHHAATGLDHIITISEFNRKRLARWGVDSSKVSVIRPGVDYEAIANVAPAAEQSEVIYVGRMVRDHHVERLVETARVLKSRFGKDVRVVAVGGGPQLKSLRYMAGEIGAASQFRFTGLIENHQRVFSLLKASKVFLFPSSPHGGWNISCVEANAAGLPVVTSASTEIGRAGELIADGENGLVAKVPTPEAFAELVDGLLSNGPMLAKMGAMATDYARRFDWKLVCKETTELYGRLVYGRN